MHTATFLLCSGEGREHKTKIFRFPVAPAVGGSWLNMASVQRNSLEASQRRGGHDSLLVSHIFSTVLFFFRLFVFSSPWIFQRGSGLKICDDDESKLLNFKKLSYLRAAVKSEEEKWIIIMTITRSRRMISRRNTVACFQQTPLLSSSTPHFPLFLHRRFRAVTFTHTQTHTHTSACI